MKILISLVTLFVSLARSAELWLYCGSLDNYTTTELDDPLPLLSNTCFDEALNSIFYVFGYDSSPTSDTTVSVIQSYLTVGNLNVFLINWSKEADPDNILLFPIQYPAKAIPNAKKVGEACGKALDVMSNATLNLDTTHIIGHSLGAHLAGYCGTEVQTYHKIVSRVTGMDPAGPGYEGLISLTGLTATCASFVDAYHTNPGVFGIAESLAMLDVWFNCEDKYQPKCENLTLLEKDVCSHLAVAYYVAEAVLNPLAFAAAPSASCSQWTTQGNTSEPIIYVSEDTDPLARGNYYLRTNAESPYGMGIAGAVAST